MGRRVDGVIISPDVICGVVDSHGLDTIHAVVQKLDAVSLLIRKAHQEKHFFSQGRPGNAHLLKVDPVVTRQCQYLRVPFLG